MSVVNEIMPVEPGENERRNSKWDIKNAPKNYISLAVSQILSAFLSFFSVWLMLKYLGAENYGFIVSLVAASQIIQISVNWTSVALAKFGSEEFVLSGRISRAFWSRTFILVPIVLILLITSRVWLSIILDWLKLPPEFGFFVLAYFLVMVFWVHIQQSLQAAKLPRILGFLLSFEKLFLCLSLLFLISFGQLNLRNSVLFYICSSLFAALVGLFHISKLISFRPEFHRETIKSKLKFSFPLIPLAFFGFLTTNYLDAIFINQFLSKTELGIYSLSYQINIILMQFPTLAGTIILPLFVTLKIKDESDKIKIYMENIIPLIMLLIGILYTFAAFATYYLIPLFWGSQFEPSVVLLWILISGTAFAVPSLVGYIPFYNSYSATYIGAVNAFFTSIANVAANYYLIPLYGLKGCAWATTISFAVSFIVTAGIFSAVFKIRPAKSILSLLPILTASIYASLSENFIISLILFLILLIIICLVNAKNLKADVLLFRNYIGL